MTTNYAGISRRTLLAVLLGTPWATCGVAAGPADNNTIVFTMYTVHDGVMKLTAQLYPLSDDAPQTARLEVRRNADWKPVAQSKVVEPGWTVPFRVDHWDSSVDIPFRVLHGDSQWAGVIRKDPVAKDTVVVAAFTGNSPNPGGGTISKQDIVDNVEKVDPDLLVFTGDQVYNHNQHTMHWIKFGETFGQMMRSRPTVCLPDDHDVGHGNLWGAGGRHTKRDTDGGYYKPPEYIKMVERAQTSHMPDPFDPRPVERGIGVYFTSLNVGGIDFAIIEDRKFKSGCKGLVTKQMGPRPDHIATADYDPKSLDVPGKKLLGERQLEFLRHWAADWQGAEMKAVVSQTVFSMVQNYHSADKRFYYADLDSNGWPQTGRNKALREIRKAFAFHICGDQHLASVVQYGVDEWGDAGFAFCVPAIANLWPRWWLPPQGGVDRLPDMPSYTGKFHDGFGNKMTVFAVSNPSKTGREPAELHDRAPGWGIVRFDKKARQITMECWPRMIDPTDPTNADKQYPGWPRVIQQTDNYARKPAAYLPTLKFTGITNPVVQVIDESDGQIVYTLRIRGDSCRLPVFKSGKYTLHVGEPGTPRMKELSPIESGETNTINVQF